MMNLILGDKYQSDTDQPSGTDGSDSRNVSWNSRSKTDTSSVDTRGDLYDTVKSTVGGK